LSNTASSGAPGSGEALFTALSIESLNDLPRELLPTLAFLTFTALTFPSLS